MGQHNDLLRAPDCPNYQICNFDPRNTRESASEETDVMAAKDFGSIESDYAFFMAHATEAESDAAEYTRALAGFAEGRASIRLLDFGGGTGEFTQQLLSALNWSPQALQLTLVEP